MSSYGISIIRIFSAFTIFLLVFFKIKFVGAAGGLMYPGTKWCGPGTTAVNDDDLGRAVEEDKCCRAHDWCPDFLLAQQESPERNLKNSAPFTKLNCKCDKEFRECLKRVNTPLSNNIGAIYFAVQTTCYRLEYPIVGCQTTSGFESLILKKKEFIHRIFRKITHRQSNPSVSLCLNYKVDKNRPKKWQWVNLPQFYDNNPRPVFSFSEEESLF